jgi:hypothetical protein
MTLLSARDEQKRRHWRFLAESSIFSPAFCTSWPAPLQVLQPDSGTARANATANNATSDFMMKLLRLSALQAIAGFAAPDVSQDAKKLPEGSFPA